MKTFCVKCGKPTPLKEMKNGLCKSCYTETKQKKESVRYPEIKVKLCSCGNAMFSKSWIKFKNIEELIDYSAYLFIKNNKINCIPEEINYPEFNVNGKTKIEISLKCNRNHYHYFLKIIPNVCNTCSRLHGNYYESIIQLRGKNQTKVNNLKETIQNMIKSKNKKIQTSFISKKETLKSGYNLYIGSNKATLQIIKELKKTEPYKNYTYKQSFKVISQKDGKEIKRITYLIRIGEK